MKKLLLTLLVLSSSLLAFSQGTWSKRTYFPDSVRGEGIGFAIGSYGYMGLGSDYNKSPQAYYKDFWQFDPSTDSWTRKADYPGTGRAYPATFVIGNYGYVVTGLDSTGNNYVQECWQYNSITDTWTQKANFPGTGRYCATGFAIGGKGYVGNGFPSANGTDFWAYDTTTDSWAAIANFGGTGRYCASGFAIGGRGYVCFGLDPHLSEVFNDMWEYDTASNSWTQKSSAPGNPLDGASGFVIGADIYVGTGQRDEDTDYSTFWQYNTITDTWKQQANYPDGGRVTCSAFAIGDTGYMGLGWDTLIHESKDYDTNSVYRFIPDTVTTSITNVEINQHEVSVYPNPFAISCSILLPGNLLNSILEFTLYDAAGREIDADITYSKPYYILHRDKLNEGIYILSIHYNNSTIYKKIVLIN